MKPLFGILLMVAAVLIARRAVAHEPPWYFPEGGTWQPSDEVVREIATTIEDQVERMAKQQRRTLRPWAQYSFQVQGQERDGRKYIYVNALCKQKDASLLESSLVYVMDGGDCFFQVKYDPVNKVFYDLHINGEA